MVAAACDARGISEVLHFTTNRGLVGSLVKGRVLSRARLPKEDFLAYILHNNSKIRPEASVFFDKSENWLDYINLSISEINTRFFGFSKTWDHNAERWWVILSFDPVVMSHEGVYFATTNNGYEHCVRAAGVDGFEALFGARTRRKGAWSAFRLKRAAHLATCEQAEVLYPGELPLEFLRRIYVRTEDESDRVRGWLKEFNVTGVIVEIAPDKFKGAPN